MHNIFAWLKGRFGAEAAKLRAAVSRRAADLHVRMRKRIVSPRTLISRLGTAVACITILAPPALYAWVSTNQFQQHALEQASIGARHIEVQLSKKETIDWLAQASMNVLHATQGAKSSIAASWVTDTTGATLMFQGQAAWWPELWAKAKINAGVFHGYFHVAVSTRQIFLGTMQTAFAFLVLGLAAYYCFQHLPLAALDRALQRLEAKQQELIEQKGQLEMQNLRFDAALNNMSQGLCMFDGKHELVVCNTPYAKMYGLPEELTKPGTSFHAIMDRRIANGLHIGKSVDEYMRDVIECMVDDRPIAKMAELSDGRAVSIKQRRMPDGGWISTHEDITEIRRIEARVAYLARHDVLTDLPNRLQLRERLEEAVASTRKGENVAVLCLDLDRFKEINDTLGHEVGDTVLCDVGTRLTRKLRGKGMIARLGGDEFAIFLPGVTAGEALEEAEELLRGLDAPFATHELSIDVDASIGLALSPVHGTEAASLLQHADVAMYTAKQHHGGIEVYDPESDQHSRRRLALASELRVALEENQLEVHYQPVVRITDGSVVGAEALVRWKHTTHGWIPPDEFIPLAEHTSLIRPLTLFVLETALAQAASWRHSGQMLSVSVNLSARSLLDLSLPHDIARLLLESGVPASGLTLEITESSIMSDPGRTEAVLDRLHLLGIGLSIDDFGTGYSSLSYLKRLPVDQVKIDKSFVINMASDENDAAIVRSTVDLGHNLGLRVVAEGVEEQEAWDKLLAVGCDLAQGYLLSRPLPATAFVEWLGAIDGRSHRAAPARHLPVAAGALN